MSVMDSLVVCIERSVESGRYHIIKGKNIACFLKGLTNSLKAGAILVSRSATARELTILIVLQESLNRYRQLQFF